MKADTPVDSKGAAIEKILNKYVSNYDLEVLGFRQSGQQTVIREILAILAQEVKRTKAEVLQRLLNSWAANEDIDDFIDVIKYNLERLG